MTANVARRAHAPARAHLHHHDPFRGNRLRALPRIGEEPLAGPVSVLAYVDRYPPFINAGAEWMLHAMLRDSVRRGNRVRVATGCVAEPCEVEGVEVYPASHGPELAETSHVVVSHLLWTNEAIRLATGAELPLLYIAHNDSQLRYWRLGEPKISGYVYNSEWIAASYEGSSEVANVPGIVVRPPLVAADYAVASPPPAEREFVTLVNPIEAKGAEVFYKLAERHPERRFLAVEGAYGSQRRPSAKVRNVAWQPQTGNMRDDVLARTRVLLMPSSYESWGRAAVEAMAAGIPVVATPTEGLQEALGERWELFAAFGDRKAWSAALALLDDPGAYEAASEAALARAAELDELAVTDLDGWDRLLRLAAGGTVERMGHDPFRARSVVGSAAPGPKRSPRERKLQVPKGAADVVAWIGKARSDDDRKARANAAWAAETKGRKVRKSVADAVAVAL